MSLVGVPAMDSKALGLKKPPSQDTYPQPSGVKAEPFISTAEGHSRMALQLKSSKTESHRNDSKGALPTDLPSSHLLDFNLRHWHP